MRFNKRIFATDWSVLTRTGIALHYFQRLKISPVLTNHHRGPQPPGVRLLSYKPFTGWQAIASRELAHGWAGM